ncbi:hypothetical protein SASPL_151071 [Salvia splendens]|uniref:peptidyl-tRNA hydrolase n=1 Tax=Salvia splendens TaxID=180675 RepID=A0A8X8W834_SALSN|nr:hypothetical protein SASPL_151071 [Salvia splendens]
MNYDGLDCFGERQISGTRLLPERARRWRRTTMPPPLCDEDTVPYSFSFQKPTFLWAGDKKWKSLVNLMAKALGGNEEFRMLPSTNKNKRHLSGGILPLCNDTGIFQECQEYGPVLRWKQASTILRLTPHTLIYTALYWEEMLFEGFSCLCLERKSCNREEEVGAGFVIASYILLQDKYSKIPGKIYISIVRSNAILCFVILVPRISMTEEQFKSCVTLEVKGETQLLNLSEKLKAGGVAHKLWIEQPENIATSLATKPYPKSTVSSFFKDLKLYGAVEFALSFEIERHEAESPVALHVQRLHHSAAVGTRAAHHLPPNHPLVFIAHEHQAHLSRQI